jgi:tetratricopeptide (TPR) repeat protein
MRAYSLVNKRLRQSPDEISTCIWKGKLENSLHAYEFAIETLKTCYRLNPDPEIQGQIAEVYLHQDRIAEARKALELSSKTKIRFLYHAREALLSKKMGQLDASHAQWDMALDSYDRMDPEPPAWVLVEIGDLYRLQGKEAQATANYQKSLGLVPRYGPALRGLKALRSQGRSQSGSKSVRLPVKSSEQ